MSESSEVAEILRTVEADPSHINFWNAYKKIQNLGLNGTEIPKEKRVKVALLSSFTVDPLAMYLDVKCRMCGLFPEIYVAPFNQFRQEILDRNSKLYAFNPDAVILTVMAEALLGYDFLTEFPSLSTEQRQQDLGRVVDELQNLISELTAGSKALTLVTNFIIPWFTPSGILDNKEGIGYAEFFRSINHALESKYRESGRVFIVDLDRLASIHGKRRCMNAQMYYLASLAFDNSFLPIVADGALAYLKALKNLTRKSIVLDLDNTLWGGVVGEDGFNGIKLSSDPPGNVYVDFQRLLLSYHNQGVILAINSNNNIDEAMKVIREHPYMVLREKHFAATRINWEDKTKNMVELADELNISLDSMVFVDDLPQNRDKMRRILPAVLVVDLPPAPYLYRQTLENLNEFNVLALTDEDKRRGEMYYARRKRDELRKEQTSLQDFLESLGTKAAVLRADEFSLPRIGRLVNKTNQFNMTTRRYTDAELKEMIGRQDCSVLCLHLRDKFGDEGIVGVAIIRKKDLTTWVLDSFLMSCRVLGRGAEKAFLVKIAAEAKKAGVSSLIGEFIPTEKNEVAEDFYQNQGFHPFKDGDSTRYVLDLTKYKVDIPSWIDLSDG